MNGNSICMKKFINNLSDRFVKITDLSGPEAKKAYSQFVDEIGTEPENNVWYDSERKQCFGADYTYENCSDHTQACFLTKKENFKYNLRHGLPCFDKIKSSYYKMGDLAISEDFIIEKSPKMKKFANKTILIVGSGPSVDMIDLQSVETDFVWVCNDFLNHKKIPDLNPSLFYMSNQTYKKNSSREFLLKNNECLCCFDVNVNRDFSLLKLYKSRFQDQCILFSTRVFTTIGIMPRIISLAAELGAKEIKVVGIDGHPKEHFKEGKSISVFEKEKKTIPKGQTYDFQLREYIVFWEYIKNSFPNLKITNLGEVYEHNVTRSVLEII